MFFFSKSSKELSPSSFVCRWRRIVRTRVGVDKLRTDIFYITPCSRRLRTFPEIHRYLDTRGITDLPLDCFTFSRKLEIGEVQDDQDEGGIKISRRGRKRTTPLATPTSGDETIAAMTTMSGKQTHACTCTYTCKPYFSQSCTYTYMYMYIYTLHTYTHTVHVLYRKCTTAIAHACWFG